MNVDKIPEQDLEEVHHLLQEGRRLEAEQLLCRLAIQHKLLNYEARHLARTIQQRVKDSKKVQA